MRTLISSEEEEAKTKKFFSFRKGTDTVELTQENVSMAMAIISLDSNYANAVDINTIPTIKNGKEQENFNLGGSSAFWFSELKKKLIDKKNSDFDDRIIICNCVNAVDRENSTHLNSDGVGRKEISERILEFYKAKKLLDELKEPNYEDEGLINQISKETKPVNEKYNSRSNISFASKFCQIACYWLFKDKKEQDNFSKYDTVVKNVLLSGRYGKYEKSEIDIEECKKNDEGYVWKLSKYNW